MSKGHILTMTRDEEPFEGAATDLPPRVIVDQHGHYWRDYGTHLSMPAISDENSATDVVATYHLSPGATLAEWMPVVSYCAEEARRQYYYENHVKVQQRAALATGWMLDAWAFAMAAQGPLTLDLVVEVGRRVEPHENEKGIRRIPIWVGTEPKTHPADVERLLTRLIVAYNEGRVEPVTYPGKTPQDQFYYEYENIHPFRDGNGRSGKVLYNLLRGTLAAPEWPPRYWEGVNP